MMIPYLTHPDYLNDSLDWLKWRLTYRAGRDFIHNYLYRLSQRETESDFSERRSLTYCPAFAKLGINEVKDSIYNRMADITREGGSASYTNACKGADYGVDMLGSSMNYFMGCKVLPELLVMQKVGIYVDMPPLAGSSLADNQDIRPYIYTYQVEDIRNWCLDESYGCNEFSAILLQENVHTYDPETGFPTGCTTRYRHLWKNEFDQVCACFYIDGQMCDQYGDSIDMPINLGISKIPFVLLDIGDSLMKDIADYQIALLNLASTDMIYAVKSNFPFYTEQADPRLPMPDKVETGTSQGRQYGPEMERPGFIHPSSEPLKVSMEKQEQLKREIKQLLKLAITNLTPPAMASAESKSKDTRTLEDGLSYIGLTLELAETKIAELWQMYEGSSYPATVIYPKDYSLHNDEDSHKEAEFLTNTRKGINSPTYQKSVQKRLSKISLGMKVSSQTLNKIESEIDAAPALVSDPETIFKATEDGLCSLDLASKILGFPDGEVAAAKQDHAERLARIMEAQTVGQARGLKDSGADPNQGKKEKQLSRDKTQSDIKSKVRGNGK